MSTKNKTCLKLYSGDKLISKARKGTVSHQTKDIRVEYTGGKELLIKNGGNHPFITIHFKKRGAKCMVDILNVPYIDVGQRKIEAAKKEKEKAKTVKK